MVELGLPGGNKENVSHDAAADEDGADAYHTEDERAAQDSAASLRSSRGC